MCIELSSTCKICYKYSVYKDRKFLQINTKGKERKGTEQKEQKISKICCQFLNVIAIIIKYGFLA